MRRSVRQLLVLLGGGRALIPTVGADRLTLRAVSSVVEQGAFNPRVAGSIPARPTGVPTPTTLRPGRRPASLPGRRAEDVVVPEVRRAIAERPRGWEDEV